MIKHAIIDYDLQSLAELARRCNWSTANLSNKMTRNSWKIADLEKIAAAMGCDLVVEFRQK